MSPLFIEHLDIVTQNFETTFFSVNLHRYFEPTRGSLDNVTNFFPKIM